MERCFYIIGAGLGTAEHLTQAAAQVLHDADTVLTTARLSTLRADAVVCSIGELAARAVSAKGTRIAVLVSGDVGFFSAAAALQHQLAPHGQVQLFCGISSLQYFCAKCSVSYDDICVRSLHGRAGSVLGAVSYQKKVFALTGGVQRAQEICRTLTDAGLGGLTVHIGENLGAADERVETETAAVLAEKPCGNLAVLLVEHPQAVPAFAPVRDAMLTRGNVPMTKEEVRWVSTAKLCIQPTDTVWDVGAGTGAVTLALARNACDGIVYAVERNEEAIALLQENRTKLGGYNVQIVAGLAPEVLSALPAPHAVFVGGSGGQMHEILRIAKEKNPAVRVVVNAIALETLQEAQAAMQALDFAHREVVQLSAARGKAVGHYTMMTANNPVFILSGGEADEA